MSLEIFPYERNNKNERVVVVCAKEDGSLEISFTTNLSKPVFRVLSCLTHPVLMPPSNFSGHLASPPTVTNWSR